MSASDAAPRRAGRPLVAHKPGRSKPAVYQSGGRLSLDDLPQIPDAMAREIHRTGTVQDEAAADAVLASIREAGRERALRRLREAKV